MRTLLSPYTQQDAVELGRAVFRKQILPVGSIVDPRDPRRRIDFTRDYLTGLVDAFRQGALDMVPFQLADADNAHTNDPERMRGQVKGLEMSEDGLDAVMELSDDAAQLVRDNPRLGVSAKIAYDHSTADGSKSWRQALVHVLGTLNPKITAMRPWEAVSLAYDNDETVDLTAATYEGEPMSSIDVSGLSEENAAAVSELVAKLTPAAVQEPAPEQEDSQEEQEEQPAAAEATEPAQEGEGQATVSDDGMDVAIQAAVDAAEAHANSQQPAGAALSNDDTTAVDLATADASQAREEARQAQTELAKERGDRECAEYVADGVPPAMVDLARPILTNHTAHAVELSNADGVTTPAVDLIRSLLEEARGTVNLAAETGTGSDADQPDETPESQAVLGYYANQI